jgi:hypothetical protein
VICKDRTARGRNRENVWMGVVLSFCVCTVAGEMDALRQHILEIREAPLTHLDVQTTLHITDFGAVPDDGNNDYKAFAAALKEARKSPGPVQIVFSPGVYHFASDLEPLSYNDGAFHLLGVNNLVIEGSGAEIIINRSHMSLVYAKNCTNIIVRNFTVDYDPLPFTQGTVEDVNAAENNFILKLDEGYPDPSQPPFTTPGFASFGAVMRPDGSGRLKENVPDHILVGERKNLGDGRVRLALSDHKTAKILKPGDRFVLNCRAGAMARAFDTENITLQNVTAHAIPGCFVQGANLSKVNVIGCKAQRKDGRLIVSGADGIHVQAARVGPWVENCDFEGLSDDCFVIYNIPNYILEQPEPDRVRVSFQERIRVGDRLLFFNPRKGEVIRIVTALSVDSSGVKLSAPVDGLMIKPEDGRVLPAPMGNVNDHGWKDLDHIYNLDTAGDYFVVRNNYFHAGRRYGIFIMASHGLVERNRIERLSGTALAVFNIPHFPGGFWSRNTIISHNTIEDCGDHNYRTPVRISGFRWGWDRLQPPFHKNLFFVSNRISGDRLPLLELASIETMELTGNTFISGIPGGPLITGTRSANLIFESNEYISSRGEAMPYSSAVQMDSSVVEKK